MKPRLVPLLSLVLAGVVWTPGPAFAQPPPSDTPPPSRAEPGDLIRESDLKFRLEDADGNLVPVPLFTLELFDELLKLQNRLKTQPASLPTAVFAKPIELDGRVDPKKHFARLQVTFQIRLPSRVGDEEQAWTAIPLRLDDCFLDVGAIEHEEEGEIYVIRDEAAYVCWLRAAPGSTHTIRVPIKIPVQQTGTQNSLDLMMPNMPTTMRLTVDEKEIDASSPSERNNVSVELQDSATVITVSGGGGKLDLAWQERGQALPNALEANCATTVHVHGNHIRSEAQLKVRSRGKAIDTFIVRLPEGMRLTSPSNASFQISEQRSTDSNGPQYVLVKRLDGPTQNLIEVHLEAELPPITVETQRRAVPLAGFSVQDAVRQWGSVDVTLDGAWSPIWRAGQFVQRVAVPEAPAAQEPVVARFLYDRQPYSLRLELRPKQASASLDTTYIVDVADDKIQLDARIVYSTNGAKVDSLRFKMPGWTIETDAPQQSPDSVDEPGTLTLPIAADATEFDFRVRAHRMIEKDATEVSFDLPRPADSELLPNTTLIVLASDNVELTPELAAMKWLTQEPYKPTTELPELPERVATPLLFREELSTESDETARFVARRRIRPRETSVAVTSIATLDGDMVKVSQSFYATVAYAPLAELPIAIPTRVVQSGTLRIVQGEQELMYREVTALGSAAETEDVDPVDGRTAQTIVAVVSLPTPVTGEVQVDMTFEIPRKDITSAEGLQIPLVQPWGDEATESVTNTLTFQSDEKTAIALTDESWTEQPDASSSNGKHELQVRSTGVTAAALVQTSIVESRTNGSTSVSRVWIQSWLDPTARHDRVCFQLLSDQPLVHIQLPATAQSGDLRVLVEGEPPIELPDLGDRTLVTVTLADDQVGRVVGLEVWYYSETTPDSRFGVAVPSIIGADRAERVYWQVVLPRNEHLAWTPATLTSELVWQRDQWYWGRRGRLEQQALEELVGASTWEPVSPNTNRYLFSSTGSVDSVGFVKVSRLMLMLVSSGLALVVVLPFIYFSTLRRPAVLSVVGVMLFGVAVTYPERAALLGQASAIGLGLAIVAWALHRLLGRSPMTPAPRRSSIYVTPDSQASGVPVRITEGSSRATTATAPAHLQVAQVEGES